MEFKGVNINDKVILNGETIHIDKNYDDFGIVHDNEGRHVVSPKTFEILEWLAKDLKSVYKTNVNTFEIKKENK